MPSFDQRMVHLLCKGSLAKTQLRFLSMFLLQRRHFLIREESELAQERSNQGIGDANKELVKFKHRSFGLIQPNRSTCIGKQVLRKGRPKEISTPALFPNLLPASSVISGRRTPQHCSPWRTSCPATMFPSWSLPPSWTRQRLVACRWAQSCACKAWYVNSVKERPSVLSRRDFTECLLSGGSMWF